MNKISPEKLKLIAFLPLSLFIIVGIYLRWKCLDEVFLNEWISRDFDRAFNIFDGVSFPLAGPELSNGGRLPGPFMYIFLCIPLFFHYSYESIFAFNFILGVGSIGLLFWVTRRFFGIYISALCTILFSLNLSNIGTITFPFNPAYIFPFTILFLWFLLELTVSRKAMYLAGLGIVVCLGIQFHYSVVTYAFVVIFVLAFFKIRIGPKVLIVSLFSILMCLLPYGVYKSQNHVPNNVGEDLSFEEQEPSVLGKIIKMVIVQNTIRRISDDRSFFKGNDHSDVFKELNWFVLSFCFYFMVVTTTVRAKKSGIDSCRKEIVVLAMFYIPSLIYELSHPYKGHFWYTYIFAVSQILIVVMTIAFIFRWAQKASVKVFFSSVFLSYLIYFSYHSVSFVQEFLSVQPKDFKQHTYKKSKVLLRTLMERLDLTPRELYEHVYLRDYNPMSSKRVELASVRVGENIKEEIADSSKNCFFVIDPLESTGLAGLQFNLFLRDGDLEAKKVHEIVVDTGAASRKLLAYEYKPRFNQACYRNMSNPYLSENLLLDAKKLLKRPRISGKELHPVIKADTLGLDEEYDSSLKLETFRGHYVFFNSHTQLPFRFKLDIKKKDGKYFLRGDIENYYFWRGPNYRMRRLSIVFINKENPNQEFSSVILNPDKVINTYGSTNLKWFREVELNKDINLTKDQFLMKVSWEINWHEPNDHCCSTYEFNNFILKKFI